MDEFFRIRRQTIDRETPIFKGGKWISQRKSNDKMVDVTIEDLSKGLKDLLPVNHTLKIVHRWCPWIEDGSGSISLSITRIRDDLVYVIGSFWQMYSEVFIWKKNVSIETFSWSLLNNLPLADLLMPKRSIENHLLEYNHYTDGVKETELPPVCTSPNFTRSLVRLLLKKFELDPPKATDSFSEIMFLHPDHEPRFYDQKQTGSPNREYIFKWYQKTETEKYDLQEKEKRKECEEISKYMEKYSRGDRMKEEFVSKNKNERGNVVVSDGTEVRPDELCSLCLKNQKAVFAACCPKCT